MTKKQLAVKKIIATNKNKKIKKHNELEKPSGVEHKDAATWLEQSWKDYIKTNEYQALQHGFGYKVTLFLLRGNVNEQAEHVQLFYNNLIALVKTSLYLQENTIGQYAVPKLKAKVCFEQLPKLTLLLAKFFSLYPEYLPEALLKNPELKNFISDENQTLQNKFAHHKKKIKQEILRNPTSYHAHFIRNFAADFTDEEINQIVTKLLDLNSELYWDFDKFYKRRTKLDFELMSEQLTNCIKLLSDLGDEVLMRASKQNKKKLGVRLIQMLNLVGANNADLTYLCVRYFNYFTDLVQNKMIEILIKQRGKSNDNSREQLLGHLLRVPILTTTQRKSINHTLQAGRQVNGTEETYLSLWSAILGFAYAYPIPQNDYESGFLISVFKELDKKGSRLDYERKLETLLVMYFNVDTEKDQRNIIHYFLALATYDNESNLFSAQFNKYFDIFISKITDVHVKEVINLFLLEKSIFKINFLPNGQFMLLQRLKTLTMLFDFADDKQKELIVSQILFAINKVKGNSQSEFDNSDLGNQFISMLIEINAKSLIHCNSIPEKCLPAFNIKYACAMTQKLYHEALGKMENVISKMDVIGLAAFKLAFPHLAEPVQNFVIKVLLESSSALENGIALLPHANTTQRLYILNKISVELSKPDTQPELKALLPHLNEPEKKQLLRLFMNKGMRAAHAADFIAQLHKDISNNQVSLESNIGYRK